MVIVKKLSKKSIHLSLGQGYDNICTESDYKLVKRISMKLIFHDMMQNVLDKSIDK